MAERDDAALSDQETLPESGRRLHLFINQERIGTLHEDNDLWTLAYDQQWASRVGSFDLSPALPRSQLVHRDGASTRPVQWYFDNLLPEEKLRELIAADARLRDKDDAFALLEYLGAESAGSLTLLPPGQVPDTHAQLQPLSHEKLSRRISNLPKITLTKDAPKRMSLAGAQHKMVAVLKGTDFYEPMGATASTHILKPDHPSSDTYPASTYLEWLTMSLAAAARLDVPPVQLLHVPQPVYAIERFDRRFDAKAMRPETGSEPPAVQRIHVIDACQLLNKSRIHKYAGASVQALRETVLACKDELTLPIRLLRWLVFNLLVANDDCHLKNLSFLVTSGRIELAPHYDLLATGVYHTRAFADEHGHWPAVSLAVRLSDEVTRFDQVTPEAVLQGAQTLGVPSSVALRAIRDVVSRTLKAFDSIYAAHYPKEPGLPINNDTAPGGSLTAQERAQHLKILRVLRFMVLPEMVKRIVVS